MDSPCHMLLATRLSLQPSYATVLPGQAGTGLALPPPFSRSTDACQFQEGWSTGQKPQALGKGCPARMAVLHKGLLAHREDL
ncbi:hypothetical protein QTO34_014517 [Cnephaeus nilssonii]|uniref:Uncharacterized protein n=1 Tax=Cnephaeus nilssonii TaxID=3371016 RepID=A0AA40I6J0_CNENI|nr:hypothetical protein QTO34_014517 [Eptesicus nilssonii]